ncbi:MAG TPA: hypothetical protein VIJ76_03710 [Galbitalea sp.]
MAPFERKDDTGEFAKGDVGSGKLKDYRYNLIPNNKRVTIQLAGSDEGQDDLRELANESDLLAFIAPRTIEEERTDAPVPVRFFTGRRMSGVVGWVPRGLESVVIEAIARLESNGKTTRIPAEIVTIKGKLRVNLLMGETR